MSNQDTDLALTYHAETRHSYDSVYRQQHFLDWPNRPRPFKLYPELEPIPLPQEFPVSHLPALLTFTPTTAPAGTIAEVTLADLAYVLFYAAGVTRRRTYPGYGEMWFRAAACTGALYHIELYLAIGDLPSLSAGLYHFGPGDFALRRLRQGDYRRVLVEASGDDQALREAPVIIVGTDTFWRNAWKYRARAYRHSFWDAGTMLANLLAAATARTLPTRLVTGFTDAEVDALLDIDGECEVSLFLVGVGRDTAPPAVAPPVTPLHLHVAPLSPQEIDYPAIRIMHHAPALESPAQAAAWRGAALRSAMLPAAGQVVPLRPDAPAALPQDPLEVVIRRRGSTRQFAPRPLSLAQLSNVLVWADAQYPC